VNYLDRYASSDGCIPDDAMIEAAFNLGVGVVYADWIEVKDVEVRRAMVELVDVLRFELHGDTVVDHIHKASRKRWVEIDYPCLMQALKLGKGNDMCTMRIYQSLISV
jgi:hypothetical protein